MMNANEFVAGIAVSTIGLVNGDTVPSVKTEIYAGSFAIFTSFTCRALLSIDKKSGSARVGAFAFDSMLRF